MTAPLPHPDQLRSFIAVAEARSFTVAAQRLGLGQSTVSQHIKRLEATLGRRMLARDTHAVCPTPDGDALLPLARRALQAQETIQRFMAASERRERLRLGVSEDFAQAGLHQVLHAFAEANPAVDVELTVGLAAALYDRFDAGELDVIFAKRRRGDRRGDLTWQERLVWIGRPAIRPDPEAPLPLLLFPSPSITRSLALEALEAAGRSWRVTCTSGSLSGLYAAAQAGLGVAPHSARLKPATLEILAPSRSLPEMGEVEFVAIGPGRHRARAQSLITAIEDHLNRLPAG